MKNRKAIGKFVALLLCGIFLAGVVVGIVFAVSYFRITIEFDLDNRMQKVQGFGASSAWTFQKLGMEEDCEFKDGITDMLYGNDGLKLTDFRYNIGAGGKESDAYADPLRGAESYFVADKFTGDYSAFEDESNYDFERDAGVRDMFERALASGNVKRVVFFSNSPHFLMTENGQTHGEYENHNNLKEECYEAYSNYLIVIANYLYKNIVCKYNPQINICISPFNEPQWSWSGEASTQEGCHFDPIPLAKFSDTFYRILSQFNAANGTEFEMDIFESACCKLDMAQSYIEELSKYEWFSSLNTMSVHSYVTEDNIDARKEFRQYLQHSIDVCVSEYCVMKHGIDTSIDMGIISAGIMLRDLKYLNAVTWNWWLAVSCGDYEDGLVYWNKDRQNQNTAFMTKRFYTFGQFSRFVTGAEHIAIKVKSSVKSSVDQIGFMRDDGSMVYIVVNYDNTEKHIKIKGFSGEVEETVTDALNDWKQTSYHYSGELTVGAKSVTTFVLK